MKRAATRAGGGAYEGAFEAVGSILVATGLGYWFDQHYETTPIGVLVGACIGFAAFVWRLVKLGRQLHPEVMGGESNQVGKNETASGIAGSDDESQGLGEGLGLSDVLRETDEETRTNEERS